MMTAGSVARLRATDSLVKQPRLSLRALATIREIRHSTCPVHDINKRHLTDRRAAKPVSIQRNNAGETCVTAISQNSFVDRSDTTAFSQNPAKA
jgi:hypothetical protein